MSHRIKPRPARPGWVTLGVRIMALAWSSTVLAQSGPEDSARKIKPAEGLEAALWAAEPMVINPTNMDVDSRGRVWVTEGLNYRLSHGRNKPLTKVEGADRIKILEDTDGDGKADKVTVFADRISPVPMGIAVEERYGRDGRYQGCKVYVGNSPDLLVLEDTDGDDKADKRYPLLTGFGGIDSDHGVHGMVLGLDGKLYFTHGDGCCSVQPDDSERQQNFNVIDKSGRHVMNDQLGSTLRTNRDGTQFEILADRQRNDYETSLNSFGNIFTSDNDDDGNRGCRVIWIMDGGNYGYHTPGSPRHWGEDVPGVVPKLVGTGNGSPCGIMVYEGDVLPGLQGAILEAEAGTRQINLFPTVRRGASFRTEPKVFLASDDPWFRPVDMTAAPDGSVFVADWYDAGVGGHAFKDQTTGRIYRVTPKGANLLRSKPDFSSIDGLIAALKSPTISTQDAARRSLIERGAEGVEALKSLFDRGEPIMRARALWVLHAIQGDPVAEAALKDRDPQIREQAVRILGRDVSRVGKVELTFDQAKTPPLPAQVHLKALLPLASDPDAGVRRELILAFRDLPTDQVGDALKALARSWDGQDRWYLEALGLALETRESAYLAVLFDGSLYGDLDLEESGRAGRLALPPYFPVDRNEAFIATGEEPLPASALSKTLGLAWRLHPPEALAWLGRTLPSLSSPELQEAADAVMSRMDDTEAALAMVDLSNKTTDPLRKRQVLATLERKLGGDWKDARNQPALIQRIESALKDPGLQPDGIALAAATGDPRYGGALMALARDETTKDETRVEAVAAVGQLKPPGIREFLDGLIQDARQRRASSPVAEAAVRALPRTGDGSDRLSALVVANDVPLGLRREALRTFAMVGDGGLRLIGLAREGKLPADLTTEATTVLNAHPDRRVRDEAASVLPLPKTASGHPLPPIEELLKRQGNADRGEVVFFRAGTNACNACHRVQGRGHWIGPDLSTIGVKYGKDELLRSILNPSAAIGYNYRSMNVALADGRIITGLPIEQTPDRLVLKTAEGQRVGIPQAEVDEKTISEVSLMPEGLAQTMDDQDLVDLLAFLGNLREPVSIVGQYEVVGPVADGGGALFDPKARIDLTAPLRAADGQKLTWRKLLANAESQVDLGLSVGDDPSKAVYLYAPVVSPAEQEGRLVLDTRADVKVWLNGKAVELATPDANEPRTARMTLPKGRTDLIIRVPGGPNPTVVTTFVTPQPLEFSAAESSKVSAR